MLYTVKCPHCGAEQKGLDLKETNGSAVCSNCEKQFEVPMADTELKEQELLLLQEILEDDTHWDLMTDRELERRIKAFEKNGKGIDYLRVWSCLRLAHVFYLKADKNKDAPLVLSSDKGNFLPIYSSKRKIGKEEKSKYAVDEISFFDLTKYLEKEKNLIGIIVNYQTSQISMSTEQLLNLMAAYDHITDAFDNMMENGLEGEELTELMFERFGGRNIRAELTDGRTIEGRVWSSHSENGNICLDVEIGEKEDIEIYRKDVKTIKMLPFD